MALYFFNLAGAVHDPDEDGIKLRTLAKAKAVAVTNAAEIIRDRPGIVWEGEELRVEVTNIKQEVLFTVIVVGVDAAPASPPEPSA